MKPERRNNEKEKDKEDSEQRSAPPGHVVYMAIYKEAEHELRRDSGSLAWSGLAAGLSMGFSLVCQAMLHAKIGDPEISALVTPFGYTVGFLFVILGRQQLFTENTLTPILPLLRVWRLRMLLIVLRLWAVVLATNLAGGFMFAVFVAHTEVLDPEVREACATIGHQTVQYGFVGTLLRAIIAGWLIALMVWLLPFAEAARVWVVTLVSYVIGLGHFSHVIAGSIASFYLLVTGESSLGASLAGFVLPTLLGNTIGGVALVAALAHAQFMAGGRGRPMDPEWKDRP